MNPTEPIQITTCAKDCAHGRSAIRSMRQWIKSASLSLALTVALFLRTACSQSKQLD
jgi:hypothetical protein